MRILYNDVGVFTTRSLFKFCLYCCLPFNLVNVVGNYLYYRSLKTLNPGTVASVFASQSTFVYILSLLFLGDKFFLLRVRSSMFVQKARLFLYCLIITSNS